MSDLVKMDEAEREQFLEFRKQLKAQAAEAQIAKLEYDLTNAAAEKGSLRRACQEANTLKLGAICVLPSLVRPCVSFLGRDPQTSLIACISFPHGGDTTQSKVTAVKNAIRDGVDEVEVTAPIAYIKDGDWGYVKHELRKLKSAAKKRALRINIEHPLLTEPEINKFCAIAADCGITSLRASSGIYSEGFKPSVISLMKNAVKDRCTIKADGVSTIKEFTSAVDMGAGIIGSKNAADLAHLILKSSELG